MARGFPTTIFHRGTAAEIDRADDVDIEPTTDVDRGDDVGWLEFQTVPGSGGPGLTVSLDSAAQRLGFTWPDAASRFHLYSATNLSPPVTWSLITYAVPPQNGITGVTIDAGEQDCFSGWRRRSALNKMRIG